MTTLQQARDELREQVMTGKAVPCPCCTQLVKIYRRNINAGMARSLIKMHQVADPEGWVHIPSQIDARSREEGKLAYWGLIEEAKERRPDGGRAGWWRITDQGRDFVLRKLTVQQFARVYDGRVLSMEGDQIDITDALGDKFNYSELMSQ